MCDGVSTGSTLTRARVVAFVVLFIKLKVLFGYCVYLLVALHGGQLISFLVKFFDIVF